MGPAFVTAFITNIQYRLTGSGEEFTGMTDAQVPDKIKIGFLQVLFKEPAEVGYAHIGYGRHLLQCYFALVLFKGKIDDLGDNRIDSPACIGKIIREYFIAG